MLNLLEGVTVTKEVIVSKTRLSFATDSTYDPSWVPREQKTSSDVFQTTLTPANVSLTWEDWWGAALKSPEGHFLTFVMSEEAYKNEWRFVDFYDKKKVLNTSLENELIKMTKDYKIRKIHKQATMISRVFGQSIVFKIPNKLRPGQNPKRYTPIKLMAKPVRPEEIYYDLPNGEESDTPTHYVINIRWGRGYVYVNIPAEDAQLYVHKEDPFGNGQDGIPETTASHDHLKWIKNIEEGFATGMAQRGISMLHMKDPDFDMSKLQAYRDAWGQPSEYNIMFSDPEVEVNSISGNTATFDLLQTSEAFSRKTSSASGVATSRLDGTQRGQVTGTQTDTDNYYSILNGIMESNNDYLIGVYELINPQLDLFDIAYDIEPKLDKQAKANIMSVQASIITMLSDYMTYNQSLTLLGYEEVTGGDIPASQWIDDNIDESEIEDEDEVPTDDDNDKDEDEPREVNDKTKPKSKDQNEGDSDDLNTVKILFAKNLLKQNHSYKIINDRLRQLFNSGLSNSTIMALKKEN